jgi:hypothetical protein
MKLFDTIALEEIQIAETENNEAGLETTESMDDIRSDCENITQDFGAADDYFKIQSILGEEPSPAAISIALIAVESIQKRLSFSISNMAIESEDDEKENKEVGFFSKVWTAIKNFFTRIWVWITGLFKKNKNNLDELNRIIRQDSLRLKKIQEAMGNNIDSSVKDSIIKFLDDDSTSIHSKIKPFNFLNKTIDVKDLENMIHTCSSNIERMKHIQNFVRTAVTIITHSFESVQLNKEDSALTLNEKIGKVQTELFGQLSSLDVNTAISTLHSNTDEEIEVGKQLTENSSNDVLIETVKVLSGYTKGHKVAFAKRKLDDGAELYFAYHVTVNNTDSKDKSSYNKSLAEGRTINDLANLNHKTSDLTHALDSYQTAFAVDLKNMQHSKVKLDKVITDLESFKSFKSMSASNKALLLSILRIFTNFIVSHIAAGNELYEYTVVSGTDIQNLSHTVYSAFEKANHIPDRE